MGGIGLADTYLNSSPWSSTNLALTMPAPVSRPTAAAPRPGRWPPISRSGEQLRRPPQARDRHAAV